MGMKILVLGKNGMLGSMVFSYLSALGHNIKGTDRHEFDAEEFLKDSSKFSFVNDYDYLINCIGIIKPFCKDNDSQGVLKAIKINALFPHELARFCLNFRVKIIQIASDCVFSGKEGNYYEDSPHDPLDVYGKTKSLGEVFTGNFLNIRCSIIGPEHEKKNSLMEWFLSQPDDTELKGFTHHQWNGVTTLQFAKLCWLIIKQSKFDELIKVSNVYHFVPNETVSKYELLNLFSRVFSKKSKIITTDTPPPSIDRTLSTKYNILSLIYGSSNMETALEELKEYMKK